MALLNKIKRLYTEPFLPKNYPPMPGVLPVPLQEFIYFGLKEALSCTFAGTFFIILALSKTIPLAGLPRYDFILLSALFIQGVMLYSGLEKWQELKAICLFHLLGLVLEIFKCSPAIGSWSYPEFAYSKIFDVPLYSGFMYAAVASYMLFSWRLLALRLTHYPAGWLPRLLAIAIYLNFFSHHFIGDYRWTFTLLLLALFWRTRVYFTPMRQEYWMPLPLAFMLIGFFIWLAENIATLFGAWQYPNQTSGWQFVHLGKISSWGLLVVITFVIIAELKTRQDERKGTANAPTQDPSINQSLAD